MNSSLEAVANFIGFAIWADGEYDATEKETVEEIADAFGFNTIKFGMAVDVALSRINPMNEEQINAFLEKAAQDIDAEEIGEVFEAVLQMVLADGVLAEGEVNNLLAIADALGMEPAQAVMLLCDMVKTEPELDVEVNGGVEE